MGTYTCIFMPPYNYTTCIYMYGGTARTYKYVRVNRCKHI